MRILSPTSVSHTATVLSVEHVKHILPQTHKESEYEVFKIKQKWKRIWKMYPPIKLKAKQGTGHAAYFGIIVSFKNNNH